MSENVIKVENVSKQYQLGEIGTGSFSSDLKRWWYNFRGKEDPFLKIGEQNDRTKKAGSKYVWALNDVSFDVKKGEVVGIIGRNGAGKSTLLKILSRTTLPTTGSIKVKGRIASLLEVGTGFHPELSGRENIFLNGAILGMRRSEIRTKLDEIIDFAGVERYIDTPVKRYSSGMYVRLAFAVAAHLEPEILVVDEVLAVGDAEFQNKCLGKMQDVSKTQGRTVLFVSHNMATMQNLCTRCILLEYGRVTGNGEVDKIIHQYVQGSRSVYRSIRERADRSGSGSIKFTNAKLQDSRGLELGCFYTGQDVKIVLEFDCLEKRKLRNFFIGLGINDAYGHRITNLNNEATQEIFTELSGRPGEVEISISKLPLMPGKYDVTIFSSIHGEVADWIQDAFSFSVESGDYYGTGKLIPSGQGNFLIQHNFRLIESTPTF